MVKRADKGSAFSEEQREQHGEDVLEAVPRPTAAFRHRAWREFQRALDPLAPPKPLRRPRAPP